MIPMWDNSIILEIKPVFLGKLQQAARLKDGNWNNFLDNYWIDYYFDTKTEFTSVLVLLFYKMKIQYIAPGVKGLLIQAGFPPNSTIFKIPDIVHWQSTGHTSKKAKLNGLTLPGPLWCSYIASLLKIILSPISMQNWSSPQTTEKGVLKFGCSDRLSLLCSDISSMRTCLL